MNFNESYFIRLSCELNVKSSTLDNQFVMLSFGSSQNVSFEVSLDRTRGEKMTSNKSKNYPAKNAKKNETFFSQVRKITQRTASVTGTGNSSLEK